MRRLADFVCDLLMHRVRDFFVSATMFALSMGIIGLSVAGVFGWPF